MKTQTVIFLHNTFMIFLGKSRHKIFAYIYHLYCKKYSSFSKTTTRDGQGTMGCRILCLFREVTKLYYHKMDWVRWVSASILGVRAHHEMEAEGAPPEPQVALAPASVPVPAIVPVLTFDINISLRVPRTEKGRYVTKQNRLLRIRNLNSVPS